MKTALALLAACAWACVGFAEAPTEAARAVIARFAGEEVAKGLTLESIPAEGGRPTYEIAGNGRTLRGSSPVALCKAFYMNAKGKGAVRLPKKLRTFRHRPV